MRSTWALRSEHRYCFCMWNKQLAQTPVEIQIKIPSISKHNRFHGGVAVRWGAAVYSVDSQVNYLAIHSMASLISFRLDTYCRLFRWGQTNVSPSIVYSRSLPRWTGLNPLLRVSVKRRCGLVISVLGYVTVGGKRRVFTVFVVKYVFMIFLSSYGGKKWHLRIQIPCTLPLLLRCVTSIYAHRRIDDINSELKHGGNGDPRCHVCRTYGWCCSVLECDWIILC